MTDGTALLANICATDCQTAEEKRARWDDDAPRLIYTDWLDEHGEPEWAEFIRVQCELASWPSPANTGVLFSNSRTGRTTTSEVLKALRRRERELWAKHGRGWSGLRQPWSQWCSERDVAGNPPHAIFRRGFIERVTCTAADCLAHLDAITAAHPVREVRLTTWPHDGERNFGRYYRDEDGHRAFRSDRWPGITFHLPERNVYEEWQERARDEFRRYTVRGTADVVWYR